MPSFLLSPLSPQRSNNIIQEMYRAEYCLKRFKLVYLEYFQGPADPVEGLPGADRAGGGRQGQGNLKRTFYEKIITIHTA